MNLFRACSLLVLLASSGCGPPDSGAGGDGAGDASSGSNSTDCGGFCARAIACGFRCEQNMFAALRN